MVKLQTVLLVVVVRFEDSERVNWIALNWIDTIICLTSRSLLEVPPRERGSESRLEGIPP